MVCEGKISLAQAQKEIATNWIAAYKKYVDKIRKAVRKVGPMLEAVKKELGIAGV